MPYRNTYHVKSTSDVHAVEDLLEYYLLLLAPLRQHLYQVRYHFCYQLEKYDVSTAWAGCLHHIFKTTFAVFRPTPGRLSKAARELGTIPLY